MTRPLPCIVALALAATASGPATGEIVQHPGYTLSLDGDMEMLVWVSEEVVNSSEPPEGLPAEWWPEVERDRTGLARRLADRPTDTACLPLDRGEPMPRGAHEETNTPPTDYATFLASSDLVVLASVQAIEPGITVIGPGQITQRVRVSVREVLRNTAGSVSPGDELTFLLRGGRLRLGSEPVCALDYPNQEIPTAGMQVILTDSMPQPGAGTFIHPSTVFAVQDGKVVLPAGTRFKDREVVLEEVRRAASGTK